VVTGIVTEEPRAFSETSCSFPIQARSIEIDGKKLALAAALLASWKGKPPAYGDEVRLAGMLEPVESARNPGQFDFGGWSRRHGVFNRVGAEDETGCEILAHGLGNPIKVLALRARRWMSETLTREVNDDNASSLILAMVLGDTGPMPQAVQQEFRGTGTFHLFSVSGLHVGILAVLLWLICKILGIPRRYAALVIIPLLFFYVLMTGLKAASLRAAIMSGIVLLGLVANRQPILLNNFCAAAVVILLWDSNQIYDPGFQFSFAVVAALLILATPLTRLLARPFETDPFLPQKLVPRWRRLYGKAGHELAATTAVSLAAWVGSLALTLGYFHMISFSAITANLVAVPLSFGIMAVSVLSVLGGLGSAWLAAVFNQTNWLLANWLLSAVAFFAGLPGSYVYVGPWQHPEPLAEIVVFDFGTGSATWISSEGHQWLIDCGPAFRHDSVLLPFLRSQGLRKLDGLILSHGDSGHIGATLALLASSPPGAVYDSALDDRSTVRKKIHEEMAHGRIPAWMVLAGAEIPLSPRATLHILYPPERVPAKTADDRAIVARLDVGNTRVLLLSDAGDWTERWLMAHAPGDLRSDILIRGWPNKASANGPDLLAAIAPRAVVAGGTDPRNGIRIPKEFAKCLAQSHIPFFQQDRCGAVRIRIFPGSCEISGFLTAEKYRFVP